MAERGWFVMGTIVFAGGGEAETVEEDLRGHVLLPSTARSVVGTTKASGGEDTEAVVEVLRGRALRPARGVREGPRNPLTAGTMRVFGRAQESMHH